MTAVNLDKLQSWIDQGRLDPTQPITVKELCKSRLVGTIKDGVKLLGNGANELKQPVHIVVSRASQSAIAAVEAVGGTVTTRFYTAQAIRRIKKGETHPFVSLKWDPVALNNTNLMTAGDGAEDLVNRAKAMGYLYRLPDPSSRKDIEYYRDEKHRGYLAHMVQGRELPSLYFKKPLSKQELQKLENERKKKDKTTVGGRLW
jgi:large subunit ribosomal protein L15